MKRIKIVQVVDARKEVDGGVEMSVHWRQWLKVPIQLDEQPSFSDVTVYDADGNVVRVIKRDELLRPTPLRAKVDFNNNHLFPKRGD